jgi:hypothetical protein
MKTLTTEEITDISLVKTGKDHKGRFAKENPFGGPRPNSGRKPMPEARKRALEAFHQAMPEAVKYLVKCLRSDNPEEQRWAAEQMIKKGIPNVDTLLVHGQLEAKPLDIWNMPAYPPEIEAAIKEWADTEAMQIQAERSAPQIEASCQKCSNPSDVQLNISQPHP